MRVKVVNTKLAETSGAVTVAVKDACVMFGVFAAAAGGRHRDDGFGLEAVTTLR